MTKETRQAARIAFRELRTRLAAAVESDPMDSYAGFDTTGMRVDEAGRKAKALLKQMGLTVDEVVSSVGSEAFWESGVWQLFETT